MVHNLSENCFKELKSACEREIWEGSSKRSKIALKALLSNELHGSVADTCSGIVTRQATEKVDRWLQSHIKLGIVTEVVNYR